MEADKLTPAIMSRQEWLEMRVAELEQRHTNDMLVIEKATNRLNQFAETCRLARETFIKLEAAIMNMAILKPSLIGIANRERNSIRQRIEDIDQLMPRKQ